MRLEEIKASNETERWTTQERQEKVRWLIARVEKLEKVAEAAREYCICAGLGCDEPPYPERKALAAALDTFDYLEADE